MGLNGQDLLQPQNSDLLIREGDNGVFVAGVHEVEVGSMEDCLHLLQIGERNRSEPGCSPESPLDSNFCHKGLRQCLPADLHLPACLTTRFAMLNGACFS